MVFVTNAQGEKKVLKWALNPAETEAIKAECAMTTHLHNTWNMDKEVLQNCTTRFYCREGRMSWYVASVENQ